MKEITLNGSKSIVNRLLIIHALCNHREDFSGVSNANDTLVLNRALDHRDEPIIDIEDAGTACRFMTAFLALTGQNNVLVGSQRMSERPIEPLVSALNDLGANISYVGKEGFLPLKFNNGYDIMNGGRVYLRADISSQFISALLMVSPLFKNGVEILMEGNVVSRPYIDMTLKIMERFGIISISNESVIKIPNQEYDLMPFHVEGDWSAASYFYSMLCISPQLSELKIKGLYQNSIQGDKEINTIMEAFGIQTVFYDGSIVIQKVKNSTDPAQFSYDFTTCPDLAQTCMVLLAIKQIPSTLTGLSTLRNKETDRLAAMQMELTKLGAEIDITDDQFILKRGIDLDKAKGKTIHTYKDHRIAMSFAPLLVLEPTLIIENPQVVSKSYPDFWLDFDSINR